MGVPQKPELFVKVALIADLGSRQILRRQLLKDEDGSDIRADGAQGPGAERNEVAFGELRFTRLPFGCVIAIRELVGPPPAMGT